MVLPREPVSRFVVGSVVIAGAIIVLHARFREISWALYPAIAFLSMLLVLEFVAEDFDEPWWKTIVIVPLVLGSVGYAYGLVALY